ncbi:hypothetical protein BE21_50715 [Sorangium cellulosum]|uniref:Uncharacterized protein n=1 Tax=Sorangium cellulosum TaxID=56 RepID=A0A150TG10_SORCE|nr:hypothetical protein BE21_50715 [Sorangium cellulosum]
MEEQPMTDEELKTKVASVLSDERPASSKAYSEVLHKLRALAAAIEESLKPDAIEVRIEPGYRVNLGQQYTFVVRVPKAGLRDVLLRAYVPVDGFPVGLDLFDGQQRRCTNLDEIETEIIGFLAQPDVKHRLLALKDIAA